MTVLACITDLSVTYRRAPRPALSGLSLDIEAGEILAIIGESGSGKSTLARAIAGLLPDRTRVAGVAGSQPIDPYGDPRRSLPIRRSKSLRLCPAIWKRTWTSSVARACLNPMISCLKN